MKKRILSMALVLCMLLAVLPPLGGVTVLADPALTATETGDNVFDDLWVYGGKRDTDYSVSNDAGDYYLEILTDTPLMLKGRAGADKMVLVRCLADVTLAGVTFEGKFNFAGTLTLADGTVNRAQQGVYVDQGFYTLTINGGELDTGKLIATGKENGGKGYSGIGTHLLDPTKDCLTVTINGGVVVATGAKLAPGIGAMDYRVILSDPAGKTVVTVNGGTVVATGGEDAPGIGAGTSDDVSATGEGHDGGDVELTVNGGCVIATGGEPGGGLGTYSPAGISGGAICGMATPGNTTVTINGGTVTANGGDYGISGGYYSDVVKGQCTVTVNGGSLKSDAGIDATIQNSAGQPVYRHDIENPNGDAILIDGVLYSSAHITAYDAATDMRTTEKKIYPYLPNADHTVVIGTTKYLYDSNWNLTDTSTLVANPALTVTGGTAGRDYLYDDVADVFYILTNTLLTVENTDPTATVNHQITVPGGAVANVKLGGDIAISNSLTVTGKMTLDLNGYVLKMTDTGKPVVKIEIGGNLTLTDSNPTAPHKFRIDNNLWVLDETNGTKTVAGGVITGAYGGNEYDCGIYNNRGTLTMNGGNIVGNYGSLAGGVYNYGVYNYPATFIMNGGSIVGNYGQIAGGVLNDAGNTSGSSAQAVFTMNGGRIGSNAYFQANVTNRYIHSIEDRTRAVFHANGGMIEEDVLNWNGTIDCEQGNGTVFTGFILNGNDPNFSDFYGTIRGGLYIGSVLLRKTELYDEPGSPHRENYISAITGGVFYGQIEPYDGGIISGGVFLGTGIDNELFTVTGNRHAITVHLGKNVTMYNQFPASTINGTVIGDTLYYLGTPTRKCHEFDGWYTDADCTVPVDFTKPLTGDITVYAKWICTGHDFSQQMVSTDTLAFAGTCKDKATYYYSCSRCLEIEKDDTHTFEWALNPNVHTGILSDWQMDESKHWKVYTCCTDEVRYEDAHNFVDGVCECGAVKYRVTFDANGGHVDTGSATTDILGKLNTLPTPTRSADYRFDGWYTAKAGAIEVLGSTVFAADTTLYARWTDVAAPTGEITIGTNRWRSFLNNITFGLFFKDTQEVTITAADNSGEDVTVEYLLSERELAETDLGTATFTACTGSFTIEPNHQYVIYVKLTDTAGNVAYLSSNGVVLDNVAHKIAGIEDGETYCSAQTVTVSDTYAVTVTVNGEPVTLKGGRFTLAPAAGAQTVAVTDRAGNAVEITVTVNDGHTGGAADCTHKAVCSVCGDSYGEFDANAHLALTHIEAKAATAAAEGNTEYWHCAECDRYFSDRDGQNEIAAADTVIAKLPPNTGESGHTALWFALLFVSGGVLTGTVVCGKKKKRLSE